MKQKKILVKFLKSNPDLIVELIRESISDESSGNDIGEHNVLKREHWLQKTLAKLPNGSSILDAGAGELQYKKFCKHLVYVSQDFGRYDGKGNNLGLQMQSWDQTKIDILSDISHIPVDDRSFDSIMCIEVLEHLPDPLSALKEFARLIKPGGHLILTAPFCSLTHFAPFHFSSGYNRYYYEKHLVDLGFKIDEMMPNGNYFEFLAQETRRLEFMAKTYSQKKLSELEQLIVQANLNLIKKLNVGEDGSSEILNFGYHVYARKL